MFKAVLNEITLLRDALTSVSEFISEGTFKIEKECITLNATDPTMVVLVNFKFMKNQFETYDFKENKRISLNIDNLLSTLKRAKAADKTTFELDEENNKFKIIFEGAAIRKFVIPLIDLEETEPPEMNLEFDATIDISSSVLEDGIGDASIVTDTITFGADAKEFTMTANGDFNNMKLQLEKGAEGLINLKADLNISSKYSLDYLKKIIKASKISNSTRLEMGNDYPIKITFRQIDKLELAYILAPRVED
ncbi:MAG: proliferating cell nuclear antigen (pcna) [DPANN group archaeon]|nr:proliferating cell nuclear antigen (pcna) [DPANN group archaeon]